MTPSPPPAVGSSAPAVFVSYAREDGEDAARRLRERLEAEAPALDVWQDRARLEAGRGWWSQLAEAIDRSSFLILVMTPAAFRSAVIRREWRHARQRGVCVVPVLPAGIAGDFDALPRWMRKAHVHDLGSPTEWTTLLRRLQGPCRVPRVPFMAADLPPRHVARPAVTERLTAAVLVRDGADRDHGGEPPGGLVVVHGPGGFGKTTLVTELCQREDVQEAFDDGILWTTIGEEGSAAEALAVLHRALTGRPAPFVDADEGGTVLADLLGDRHCLIVVDDLWDPDHLGPFLRGAEGCLRLVTTRRSDLVRHARAAVEVGEMTSGEARTLVASGLGVAAGRASRLETLAVRLGEWPLLLELAAATLRQRLARGDDADGALGYLEAGLEAEGVVAFDRRDSSARERAVSRTLEVSLRLLDADERRRYEELSAFPGDVDVPLSAVERLWDTAPLEAERLCERLADLSLLRLDLGASVVRVHDVVDAYLERLVPDAAPLHGRLVDAWGDPAALPDAYAWRWYAHHLEGAGRTDALRRVLFDAGWLARRVEIGGVTSLIEDLRRLRQGEGGEARRAEQADRVDAQAEAVARALGLAAHVLAGGPGELAGQLLARLDPAAGPDVARLLEGASRGPGGPWLRPLTRSLAGPGGALVRTLRTGGNVTALAVTPDGRTAVVATEHGSFEVWDLGAGERLRTRRADGEVPPRGWYFTLLSPDARRAVTAPYPMASGDPGPDDRRFRILDLEGDEGFPGVLAAPGVAVRSAVLTADGGALVAATLPDGRIRGWALEDGRELFAVEAEEGAPFGLAASGGAGRVVWTTREGVRYLDRAEHPPICPVEFGGTIDRMALSADGTRLITGTIDGVVEAWDLVGGTRVSRADALPYGVIEVTPDARRVAVGGVLEGGVRVVDADTGRVLLALSTERVAALALTPDGGRVLVASADVVRVLDVEDAGGGQGAGEPDPPVTALAALPEAGVTEDAPIRAAVSADDAGYVKTWWIGSATPRRTVRLHDAAITAIALLPARGEIVTASEDGTLACWHPFEDGEPRRFHGHAGAVTAVAALPDGGFASGSADGTLRLWDPVAAREVASVTVRKPGPYEVRFRVAGLAPAGGEGVVALSLEEMPDFGKTMRSLAAWEPGTGRVTELDAIFTMPVSEAFAALPGGGVVAATGTGGIGTWQAGGDGRLRRGAGLEVGFATAVAVDATGSVVVVGTGGGEVRAWKPRAGEARLLATHDGPARAVAVSPDGSLAAAGSEDGRIHVLDLQGGHDVAAFHGDGAVTACVWLPGNALVVGERLGRVHVLSLEGRVG